MLEKIKQWLAPPIFPGDDIKNDQARMMNTIGLYFVFALAVAAFTYVPFAAKHKIESWAVIFVLFAFYLIARYFLFRGNLAFAAGLMLASGWGVCEVIAFIGGGIFSPMMFSLAAITIAVGLFFPPRVGTTFLFFSILCGLGFAFLQENGKPLPQVFSYSALSVWFYFSLSQIFINRTIVLTMRKLENTLALAQQQNEAREKAEAILQQSERRLQALIANGLDYISLLDAQGNLLWESPSSTSLLDYRFNEFLGKSIFELMHPDDQKWIVPQFVEVAQEPGSRRSGTFRLRRADGSWRWVEAVVSNFLHEPAVAAIVINYRDVTERKQAEEKLRASEALNSAVINHSPIGISVRSRTGQLLYANEAWQRIWAIPESDLKTDLALQREALTFNQRDTYLQPYQEQVRRIYKDGGQLILPNLKISSFRSGAAEWISQYFYALHDETGAVDRVVILTEDITERKHAEEAVQLSETRYRQAITAAGAVPYYRDYQQDNHSYTFMGEGILQLTGYSAAEITPDIFDQLEQEAVMRGALAHLTPDEAGCLSDAGEIRHWACDYRIIARDGQMRWVSDSAVQIRDEHGRRIGVIGILQDITDRKRAEEALWASQQKYQRLVEDIGPLTILYSHLPNGVLTYVSPAISHVIGVTPEQAIGQTINEIANWDTASLQNALHELQKALTNGVHLDVELVFIHTDGSRRTLHCISHVIKDEVGNVVYLEGVATDITERKRVEEAEHEQRVLAEALSSSAAALNSTLNFSEVLDRVLDNVGLVVPHDAANIMLLDADGDTLSIVCHRGYLEHDAKSITEARLSMKAMPMLVEASGGRQTLIVPDTRANPKWLDVPALRWVLSYLTVPIQIRQKVVGFLNLDSVTPGFFNTSHAGRLRAFANQAAIAIENARLYEEVQKLALTDILTGVFNRTFFETELARMELGRDFPVSIFIADLDNMKTTNDNLGHPAGDDLLKHAVLVLQAAFRAGDIIARIGGDEFAVLLPHTDAATAEQMLERVRAKLIEHNDIHPNLPVLLSLGTSTAGRGQSLTAAFAIADKRMYADKAVRKSKNIPEL